MTIMLTTLLQVGSEGNDLIPILEIVSVVIGAILGWFGKSAKDRMRK